MNRTFLLFLMIGTAMMIAVIGQHKPTINLDYTPWQIDSLDNGTTRVFGLTLGKTTIQEANQIFASFADTRLTVKTDSDGSPQYELIAYYDEITMSGLVASLHLNYKLDQQQLASLYQQVKNSEPVTSPNMTEQHYKLDNDTEISYLSTPISSITYIPVINYGQETIRQRFGQAKDETATADGEQIWNYPDLGLKIYIYTDQPERFIYASTNTH